MNLSSFLKQCTIAFFLRISLVVYANFHDHCFNVMYTDLDYKVFTDAARYITKGQSPYKRPTYRYTPLLAFLLIPNVYIHKDCGKIFFCLIDIVVAVFIRRILTLQKWHGIVVSKCVCFWLYNPLTIVISTRGNSESVTILAVFLTLDFLHKKECFTAGLIHGLAVHLRLYPIIFSLTIFLSINKESRFIPNLNQIKFLIGYAFSLIILVGFNYELYGYQFLYESYLYHLIRRDTKHNFSVYFYMSYLSSGNDPDQLIKATASLLQIILLLSLSYKYSDICDLPFSFLTQSLVSIVYNTVITSQYFYWFLSFLPLCLPNIKMSKHRYITLTTAWILSQGLWLFFAYLLEFQGFNTFLLMWVSGLLFFIMNVNILMNFIRYYKAS